MTHIVKFLILHIALLFIYYLSLATHLQQQQYSKKKKLTDAACTHCKKKKKKHLRMCPLTLRGRQKLTEFIFCYSWPFLSSPRLVQCADTVKGNSMQYLAVFVTLARVWQGALSGREGMRSSSRV